MENLNIAEILKNDLPENVIEIIEILELLKMALNDTHDEIGEKLENIYNDKQYETINNYVTIAKKLDFYDKQIDDFLDKLYIEKPIEVDLDEKTYLEIKKNYPDLDKIDMDETKKYTLYDDYTYKTPYAFELKDSGLVISNSWKQMLTNTCKFLAEKDHDIILNFENIDEMNGKKRKYFTLPKKRVV